MVDSSSSERESLIKQMSRRQYIRLASGAAGGVFLSGCLGDDEAEVEDGINNGDNGTSGNGNGDDSDVGGENNETNIDTEGSVFVSLMDQFQEGMHWNPYNIQHQATVWPYNEPLAYYNLLEEEFVGMAAENWEWEEDSLLVTLREGYEWTESGEPLTAEDYKLNQQLTQAIIGGEEGAEGEEFDEWMGPMEVVDEYSFRIPINQPEVSEEINLHNTIGRNNIETETGAGTLIGAVPQHIYNPVWENIREAEGEQREEEISNLVSMTVEEPEGFGPYKIDEIVSESHVIRARRESGHPELDRYPADEWHSITVAEGQGDQALFEGEYHWNGQLQFTEGIEPPETVQYVPSPHPNPFDSGSIIFNQTHDDWGRRKVRQATAYLLNMIETARSVPRVPIFTALSGLDQSQAIIETWLDDVIDDFTQYNQGDASAPVGPDLISQETAVERANSLMEEAGYTKDGDWWTRPDGSTFSSELAFYAGWTASNTVAQVVINELRDFGIDIEGAGYDTNQYVENVFESNDPDAYEICWGVSQQGGGAAYPHPLSAFDWYYNSNVSERYLHLYEREFEVPYPIGDPSGSTETVVPTELTLELSETTDPDRQSELIEELSWIFNQTVPAIAVDQAIRHNQYNTEEWEIPEGGGENEDGTVQMADFAIETYGDPKLMWYHDYLSYKE